MISKKTLAAFAFIYFPFDPSFMYSAYIYTQRALSDA